MAVRDLQNSVSGVSALKSIVLNEGYGQATVYAEVTCAAHSLAMGDTVADITMGFSDENATMLTNGIVKEVRLRRPEQDHVLTIHDSMIRAVDYFIASDDPLAPFTASNISAEALVGQLLALAGLTNYDGGYATGFTFGVTTPTKINLTSVWDYINSICEITSSVCYADNAGQVHFQQRKPYIVGGDVSEFTIQPGNSGTLMEIDYRMSDEKLRNRVVVYGPANSSIGAVAQASSPYIPSGFYKAIVIAHELIDTQAMAQRTADINLELYNRLTETVTVKIIGRPTLRARDVVRVNASTHIGLINADFIIYHARHTFDKSGYSADLTLVR